MVSFKRIYFIYVLFAACSTTIGMHAMPQQTPNNERQQQAIGFDLVKDIEKIKAREERYALSEIIRYVEQKQDEGDLLEIKTLNGAHAVHEDIHHIFDMAFLVAKNSAKLRVINQGAQGVEKIIRKFVGNVTRRIKRPIYYREEDGLFISVHLGHVESACREIIRKRNFRDMHIQEHASKQQLDEQESDKRLKEIGGRSVKCVQLGNGAIKITASPYYKIDPQHNAQYPFIFYGEEAGDFLIGSARDDAQAADAETTEEIKKFIARQENFRAIIVQAMVDQSMENLSSKQIDAVFDIVKSNALYEDKTYAEDQIIYQYPTFDENDQEKIIGITREIVEQACIAYKPVAETCGHCLRKK